MSYQRVTLLGNVGIVGELKDAGESKVYKFTVATNKKFKNEDKVTWHNIVTWGKLAEICAQYLEKGRTVLVEGEIQNSTWEKDGIKQYKTEIVAKEVKFIGKPVGPKEEQEQFNPDDLPF